MSRKSTTLFQRSLLGSTVIATILCTSPAYAQEQAAPTPQEEANQAAAAEAQQELTPATEPETVADSKDIVVTGTRIVSPNVTSLAPMQVVGETEIDQSGAINIQEVLLKNPVFGVPGLARTNSAFLTSGAGVATVDLRDLGSDRTLVLINSRRVVSGLPGSATVDLNVIPTQFIERVDILTGNASSLYGSDAIAGVVNFIYKRNFQGVLAEGQYGITSRGDSGNYQLSLTGGGNFADDRGNLMVYLGYTKEKGLFSRQRKNTRVDDIAEITYSYDPDDFGVERQPFFSSFTPQGSFQVGDSRLDRAGNQPFTFTYSPTGALQPCFTTNGPACSVTARDATGAITFVGTGVGPNGFNRQQFRTLAVPVERYLFATRGTFEITPSISAIVEATYAKTTSSREIEPFPLGVANIFPATGRAPIETMVDGVAVLNPYVPDEIVAVATDTDGDGLLDIGFNRRISELGTRNSSSTRDFYRMVTGLEGSLFEDKFNWDVTYNYGQTSEQQTSNGQPNVLNFRSALQGIPDVGDLDNDGLDEADGDVICADATARDQGCVPINIFGVGSITPGAAAYVAAEQTLQTRITQQVWAANLSGSPIDLPGGPLGVAVGAEYRKETSKENNDALTNAGLNAGNALPDTAGSFNVKEIYGELEVPILTDRPFFYDSRVRGAIRYSDYSTVGGVTTWSLGADWAPIEALRFRGTYAKAVRAPNVGELFTGPSQTFPTGLADPCVGVTLTSTGTIAEQCLANPGVLVNIVDSGGEFTISQADRQGISGFNSGNPNLAAERSRSITFGAVFAPRDIQAIKNLVLSVDYWNIKIDDAIVAPPRAFIIQQCYENADPFFCGLIQRRAVASGSNSAGSLEFVNAPLFNGGELSAKGIDFVASYNTNVSFLNGWSVSGRLAYTHLLGGFVVPIVDAPEDPFIGEVGDPKNRWNGSIAFNSDKWGISFTGTYIGESFEDNQYIDRINAAREDLELPPIDKHDITIDHEFYLDSQITFTPDRRYEFYLGVNNLLDNNAPNLLSSTTFNVTGSDTAAAVYDVFGRRYYAGVRLRF